MTAAVLLYVDAVRRRLGIRPQKRPTRIWLILERRNGYWTVASESDFKPTIIHGNQRLAREYR